MDLKTYLCPIWFLQLLLALNRANPINNYFQNLKSNHNIETAKVTANIIRNCYCKNANNVLSGDWRNKDVFPTNGKFASFPPLYKVGTHEDRHFKRHKRLKNIYKLDVRVVGKKKYPCNNFILVVSSNDTLSSTLKMLKESILWNHEGFFLIVYKNYEDRCSSAKSLLSLAWKFRLLHVTLLCHDVGGVVRLFTFNPFMHFAPTFWRFVESHVERKSTWTLYQRELNSSTSILYPSICKNLNFNKARNLGGYTVQLGAYVHPRLLSYDKRKQGMRRFGGVNGDISLAVWGFLNASAKVEFYARPGFVDDNGSLKSVLQDLLTGKIELSMNMNLIRDFWRLQSYPHEVGGFCMVTRKEPAAPASENLRRLLRGVWSPLLAAAAVLALVVALKLLTSRGLSTAALELMRLLVAAPPHSRPGRPASRGLLALFALAALLLDGYFHSELTSLDVAPRASPVIETEADLASSGLPVYGSVDYDEVLWDLKLRHRYRYGTYVECLDRLAKGERIVCVAGCYEARFNACEGNVFHLSKELRSFYLSFSVEEDWSLYSRFNAVLARLTEAGLIKYYRSREADRFMRGGDDGDVVNRHQQILRRNMTGNLYLWSLGVAGAALTFFAEICFYLVKDRLIRWWESICRALNFRDLSMDS